MASEMSAGRIPGISLRHLPQEISVPVLTGRSGSIYNRGDSLEDSLQTAIEPVQTQGHGIELIIIGRKLGATPSFFNTTEHTLRFHQLVTKGHRQLLQSLIHNSMPSRSMMVCRAGGH